MLLACPTWRLVQKCLESVIVTLSVDKSGAGDRTRIAGLWTQRANHFTKATRLKYCFLFLNSCWPELFRCHNDKCVDMKHRCDRIWDCETGIPIYIIDSKLYLSISKIVSVRLWNWSQSSHRSHQILNRESQSHFPMEKLLGKVTTKVAPTGGTFS